MSTHRRSPAPIAPVPVGLPPSRDESELDFARGVLAAESRAVAGVAGRLGPAFGRAVDLVESCATSGGTVLVTGLGKSGLIGAKISATMASLGIPSHPVHPAEAAHGDLGRFRPSDTVLALSNSGETAEVVNLCAIVRQDGLPIIAITNGPRGASAGERVDAASSLERLATVTLFLGVEAEAGGAPYAAPTCSTTAAAALGDALALAAARRRNFSDADFARRHPGGQLGGELRPIADVMRFRAGASLPVASEGATVSEALRSVSALVRRPGAILLVDPRTGVLTGIFTDGDLRRLVLRDSSELSRPIAEVMTRRPRCLRDSALVRDAVLMVREHRQDEIPVVDSAGRPVGLLDVQDLVAMRLVEE